MNGNLKEILVGIGYGIVTMLFMIGLVPSRMLSSILGCLIAVFAIIRIRKRTKAEEKVACFTISYMAVIVIFVLLLNSISVSA